MWNPGQPVHEGNLADYVHQGWRQRREAAYLRGAVATVGALGSAGRYFFGGAVDPPAKRHEQGGGLTSAELFSVGQTPAYMTAKKKTSRRRRTTRRRGRRGFSKVTSSAITAPETKVLKGTSGTPTAALEAGSSATTITMNALAVGAANGQRVGRDVYFKWAEIVLRIFRSNTYAAYNGPPSAEVFRMLIVYDRESLGVVPAIATILDTQGATTNVVNAIYNTDNISNRYARFQILCDEIIDCTPNTYAIGTGTNYQADMIRVFHQKCRIMKPTHYSTTSNGTIVDIIKGGIYAFFVGGTATPGQTPVSTYQLAWNLFYKDM